MGPFKFNCFIRNYGGYYSCFKASGRAHVLMPQVSSKDSNNPMQDNNKIEDDIIVDSFEEVTDVENLERSVSKNTPAAENFNVDNVLGTNAG